MGSKWVKIGQNWLQIAQNRPKMPQNKPKIRLRGQNKHCQNTADRKLLPNTPQGRSGCHTFAAFGVPDLATKGPKGPICCQIWNGFGSIGSVFGSSVPPNASCVTQNGLKSAQRESKWLKMAQNRPKMAPNLVPGGPKAAQVWHPLRPCGAFGRSFRSAVFWQCLFCPRSPILSLF